MNEQWLGDYKTMLANNKTITHQLKAEIEEQNQAFFPLMTRKMKQDVLIQLVDIEPADLQDALVKATINQCPFPSPLKEKLQGLQQACLEHNSNVLEYIMKAIEAYFMEDGLNDFLTLLRQDYQDVLWHSTLLDFLAKKFNLEFEQEPLVKGTVHQGKVYWKIIQDGKTIYRRQNNEEAKTILREGDTWQMTWKQFRLFKDGGKRSGTVAITRERFIHHFRKPLHYQAGKVWDELKAKGILSEKNKLSDEWRAACKNEIHLQALTDKENFIDHRQVKHYLRELEDKNISQEVFVAAWPEQFRYQAELIWQELKTQKVLDENNKMTGWKFSITDFLEMNRLDYNWVVDVLYAIANHPNHEEKIPAVPSLSIFRKDRDAKKWCNNSSSIINLDPKNEKHCTKLWDVSIYRNAKLRRNTEEEKKRFKLNYDHMPTRSILKEKAEERKEKNEKLIKALMNQKKGLKAEVREHRIQLEEATIKRNRLRLEKKIEQLKSKIAEIKIQHAERVEKLTSIEKEIKGDGNTWWTMAVPEELHKRGRTYMQSLSSQKEATDTPFLADIEAYLSLLKTHSDELSITPEDYLSFLGAILYLSQKQSKIKPEMGEKRELGTTPYALFKKQKTIIVPRIDELINEHIKQSITRMEAGPAIGYLGKKCY